MKIVQKAGLQAENDPWVFVLSDPTPDSYGDIVEPSWDLKQFKRNPIALWMHQSSVPIGTWEKVWQEGDKLMGRLALAARGTSELIDTLWSLVEQRVIRAVSVGFRPGKAEPLDENDPWAGYRLSDNQLLECSLVTVGANPNALNTRTRVPSYVLAEMSNRSTCQYSACAQLRDSGGSPKVTTKSDSLRGTTMTLSERIQQKQAHIRELQSRSDSLLNGINDDGVLSDDDQSELDGLAQRMERAQNELATLERLEQASAGKSADRPAPKAVEQGAAPQERRVPRIETRQDRPKGYKAMLTFATIAKSYAERTSPREILSAHLPDEEGMDILIRAATAPAVTGTAGWAGNLVEQTWIEYLELLRDASVYGQVPGMRVNLTGVGNMPVQGGRGNLAAGFVAENGAIPVVAGSISTLSLQPHKMGIISAYSKEMMRRMTVADIASTIQTQMISDTAEAIDTALLASTARNAGTTPAGLQNTTETGAANVNAVTNVATGAGGSTAAEILSDTNAVLARANAIRVRTGAWLMNPKQVRALEVKQDGTTGHFVFKDEIQQGRFRRMPIIESVNVTDGIVVFVGNGSMAFGSEHAPTFEESSDATLHFDSSPTALSATGTPNTVAAPIMSLFQQDLLGIKMTLGLDWRVTRQGGTQVLTSATGW